MPSSAPWIPLARILRPQGRKGEVLADLLTDAPSQFERHPHVWLAPASPHPPASATALDPLPAEVRAFWLPVGKNAGRVVLHLAGIDSIEQAEALAGREIVIPATQRIEPEPGAVYISDLVGATVFDADLPIGVVADVQFPMSADGSRKLEEAAPLLVVSSRDGDEVLIPFVRAYMLEMDIENGRIRMQLPPGLVDVNRHAPPEDHPRPDSAT